MSQQQFKELYDLLAAQEATLNLVTKLMLTDSMKYVSKTVRYDLANKLLENMGDIEDSIKGIVGLVRSVKRQRLTDDTQISNLFMNIADITAQTRQDYGRFAFEPRAFQSVADLLSNTPAQLKELDLKRVDEGEEAGPR